MKHLDEPTLNEYLDQALKASEREAVARHLGACPECSSKMEMLKSVFTELDALPDADLERDLVPSILAHIATPMPAFKWSRVFAGQVGVVLGIVTWLSMQAVQVLRFSTLKFPEVPVLGIQTLILRLLSMRFEIPEVQIPRLSFQIPTFDFQIPTLGFEISSIQMTVLAISLALLWVVGNAVLLRSRQEARS